MSDLLRRGEYTLTTDARALDVSAIHAFLTRSYWGTGISKALVQRAIDHSLCFGLFHHGEQVGFARVVSDRATFAYLADVYVLETHRGHGLSKWLIGAVRAHPDLQGLRRFLLATRDAHGLYRQFGFKELAFPARLMEVLDVDVYTRTAS
jgi:N-acetylglutamate synthase-like GNAT family acetyltransferase